MKTEDRLVVAQAWGEEGGNEGERKRGMTANVYGVSFGR